MAIQARAVQAPKIADLLLPQADRLHDLSYMLEGDINEQLQEGLVYISCGFVSLPSIS